MSNRYNWESTITGFLAGKPGEAKVKMHTFAANDRGPARQVAQVTIKVMTDGEPKFIRASFPAAQAEYLEAVPETARVTAKGWISVSVGKDGKEWWNLENAQFLGFLQRGESSKAASKPTKAKPAKAKPAPEDDEDADDDAPTRAQDDGEEDF